MLAFYAQRALVGTGCIRVFLFRPSMHLLAFLTPLLLLLLLLLLPLSRICAPPPYGLFISTNIFDRHLPALSGIF